MVASRVMIIVETNTPLQVMLGQNIGGGIVRELKQVADELLSATQLAEKYNISVQTVRRKLENFNQGTSGKYLYNANVAHEILSNKSKRGTGGARRKN
ncbi:HTH domain-containing protein [Acinetobacter soli]|uniref:HTH domain-containing protein n=1 Tax=Acinetobacter soli TaxID=487316 RepID=UPI00124C7EA2|nr:HTH domain-containing protein [Acinetobacter soli]